MHIFVVKEKVT